MNMKFLAVGILSVIATAAFAVEDDQALVQAPERSRWSFSAGPAYRSRIKMNTSGQISIAAPTPDGSDYYHGTPELVADPLAGIGGIPADAKLWGYSDTYAILNGGAWSGYRVSRSEEDSALGLNIKGAYSFYQTDTVSVGLGLRFAAYWNMGASSAAGYDVFRNDYAYEGCPPMGTFAESVDTTYDIETLYNVSRIGGGVVSTRLKTDLYQIGIGPTVTWSPFVGWCGCMDWLDIYGNLELLCNLAKKDFTVPGYSDTSVDCLFGAGGNVGLLGNVTDWLSIYGQIGYEWVDKTDATAGGFKADLDYSSMVLSAGVQLSF